MRACSLDRVVAPLVALVLAACSGGGTTSAPAQQAAPVAAGSTVVIYEGARLITGDNTPAIETTAMGPFTIRISTAGTVTVSIGSTAMFSREGMNSASALNFLHPNWSSRKAVTA